MKNNNYRGNLLVRRLVICTDFVILNCLLLLFIKYGSQIIPAYFELATKITFLLLMLLYFLVNTITLLSSI